MVWSVLGNGDAERGALKEKVDALTRGTLRIQRGAAWARASGANTGQVKAMTDNALVDLARQTNALAQEVAALGAGQPTADAQKAKPVTLAEMVYGKSGHISARSRFADDAATLMGRVRAQAKARPEPSLEAAFGSFEGFLSKAAVGARRRRLAEQEKEISEGNARVERAQLVREGRVLPL